MKLSVQMFQPLNVIYRRGCKTIYRPLKKNNGFIILNDMHSPNLTFSHSHKRTHTHNNTRIGARISAFVFFLPVQIGEGVVMDLRWKG